MSVLKNAVEKVREFTVAQRTISILLACVLVAIILGGVYAVTRPTYTPMFSGLSSEDAAAVVEQLQTDGTAYQIADGGATIMVPTGEVDEARMSAAAQGLPTTSSGAYSLLDTLGATASEFQQDTTWQRVLQTKIAEAIGTLDGVEEASVTFTVPEETVFTATKDPATASVVVRTSTGVTLNDEQISSILHIVAGSVKGMDRTNIAISDTTGKLLSAIGGNAEANAAKEAAEHEIRISQSLTKLMDQVVGPNNSTVSVVAEMSSDSAEQVSESFGKAENGTLPLTEKKESEEYEGTGANNGGVLGTDNITTGGAGGTGNYSSEKTDTKNAVNKVTENRIVPAGQLQRQTISVVIDGNAVPGINQADITAAITNAAGINAARGDQLTVRVMPFDTSAADRRQAELEASKAAAEAAKQEELIRTAIIAGSIVLGALILGIIILVATRKRRKEDTDEVAPLPVAPRPAPVEPPATETYVQEDYTAALPLAAAEALPEPPMNTYESNLEDLKMRIDQDPKSVAGHFMGIMAKDGK